MKEVELVGTILELIEKKILNVNEGLRLIDRIVRTGKKEEKIVPKAEFFPQAEDVFGFEVEEKPKKAMAPKPAKVRKAKRRGKKFRREIKGKEVLDALKKTGKADVNKVRRELGYRSKKYNPRIGAHLYRLIKKKQVRSDGNLYEAIGLPTVIRETVLGEGMREAIGRKKALAEDIPKRFARKNKRYSRTENLVIISDVKAGGRLRNTATALGRNRSILDKAKRLQEGGRIPNHYPIQW